MISNYDIKLLISRFLIYFLESRRKVIEREKPNIHKDLRNNENDSIEADILAQYKVGIIILVWIHFGG